MFSTVQYNASADARVTEKRQKKHTKIDVESCTDRGEVPSVPWILGGAEEESWLWLASHLILPSVPSTTLTGTAMPTSARLADRNAHRGWQGPSGLKPHERARVAVRERSCPGMLHFGPALDRMAYAATGARHRSH